METVREVTGTRNITSNKNEREGNEEIITRDETAAQILERRRKQVNKLFIIRAECWKVVLFLFYLQNSTKMFE